MNRGYGKNSLQLWEYKTDSAGHACGGSINDGAMCIPRVTIRDGGNVGIGTTSPIYQLHTNGTSYANNRAGGPVDYSEYFESKKGKEIKPGISVAIDGDKIRPAQKKETPIDIISIDTLIVGGVPVGWPKKYLRDEFGNQIMEEYKEEIMVPKKEKVKKQRLKMEKKTVKEKVAKTGIAFEDGKYFQKEITETVTREVEEPVFKEVDLYDAEKKKIIGKHRIPVMETYEEEIDFLDEKGQPVAPTWIKIKDISDDVELWLVK